MTFCLDSEYNRSGSIWHCFVKGASAGQLYLYRAEGEYAPEKGLRFDSEAHLFDPYAKAFTEGSVFKAYRMARAAGQNINTGSVQNVLLLMTVLTGKMTGLCRFLCEIL